MRLALAATALLALMGCSPVSRDQVAWTASPDQRIHAILLETNGGATTSFGYEIELHPASNGGEKPIFAGKLNGAARSECSYGVNLRWLSSDQLAVEFLGADKVALPDKVQLSGKTVRIVARTSVSDENAPCGGMLASKG
jgi:hypothetical protein